jgi:hypothetical protein
MLSLHLFYPFSNGCGVCKYIFVFISRTQSNLPTSLRYSEKDEKKAFIELETVDVMKWVTAEYRRNCLTVFARGQLSDDMRCWYDL